MKYRRQVYSDAFASRLRLCSTGDEELARNAIASAKPRTLSMASIAAASWGAQAMRNKATLGPTVASRCQCLNAMSRMSPSIDQTMPICKMGARRARAYQKKPPVKKVLGKSSSPADAESIAMEGGKEVSEQGSEIENGNVYNGVLEQLPSNAEETSALTYNVAADDELQHAEEADAASQSLVDSMSTTITISEDGSFIKIMEDLMKKVKDAEKNILTLNEARIQSLEQLEQIRRDNDTLQAQLEVLQLQLAEADIKLKAATQEKARTKLLEEEIDALKGKLLENLELMNTVSSQDADNATLSKHAKSAESEAAKLAATEAEMNQLKKENQMLHKDINLLQSELVKTSEGLETMAQLQQDRDFLQGKLTKIESQLARAESNAAELAKLRLEKQVALQNLQRLEAARPSLEKKLQISGVKESETAGQQDKVYELEALVSKLENENGSLIEAYAENERLRNQIKLLEQRLAESDAEIRAQMEIYQAELEAFQASVEKLKVEKSALSGELKADDMPWEFWSHVLLSIDGWLLEKKLSLADGVALREIAWQRESRIRDVFVALKGQPEKDIIAGLLELLKTKKRPGMHIVHIAAEMAPVAKVGGLGDVVTGLGRAFQKRDHLVEVVLPKYDCMDYSRISNLRILNIDLNSYFDGHTFKNKIWVGTVEGLPVYFIEPHHPARFFWRGGIYGEKDDFKRFTYFSRAALEFVLQAGKRPDIIHCHDWHTSAVAPLYWDVYVPQGLDSARIAFTCHNFEYQGTDSPAALASCGLDPQQLHRPDRMQDNFVHNRINLLKGAIVFSNIVTTVSPTYAQEARNAEGGKGLHLTLMAQSHKFFGILNGIDTESWNPASDLLITHQYSAEDISGKAANKAALRSTLRLSGTALDLERPIHLPSPLAILSQGKLGNFRFHFCQVVPLVGVFRAIVTACHFLWWLWKQVGCITRLVPQKGVHLIRHAIFRTLELGGQFVLLGSSPIDHIQREFEGLAQQFNQHPHIRLVLKYDEALSHSIYAGADIFIIPSIFEPCGLTQMIAMRYGAIPVARKTGGLNDSVFDVDDEGIPLQTRNGFTFSGVHEKDLNHALDRALNYFVYRKEWWQDLVRKAMIMDFSWNSSASQYTELYERAIARARLMKRIRRSSQQLALGRKLESLAKYQFQ
ncbi:hypothetical protein GOP47_0023455 [Adiantum capillus-veneris]|uniref:starch synthase n=1 Tax=Adiantum capillus-veneris TaxID=13818 RepID=A0A9D4U408_ADICA|nr:hypothetical protein GOP47_0023455 [Adiantum capillus-veneris]